MLMLLLRGEGAVTPALSFDEDQTELVLGRGSDCDVVLPDPSVSECHALIRKTGANQYVLSDSGSANGTFVGDEKLVADAQRLLRDGDLVRLGRVWLEARTAGDATAMGASVDTRELAMALVSQTMRARREAVAKVHVKSGPDAGRELSLDVLNRPYVVGREKSCALPLRDPSISRAHVKIVRTAHGVFVRDLGSKNGARIGRTRLKAGEEAHWPPGKLLGVGDTVLLLRDTTAATMVAVEAATDEPSLAPPPMSAPPPWRAASIEEPTSAGSETRLVRAPPVGRYRFLLVAAAALCLGVLALVELSR